MKTPSPRFLTLLALAALLPAARAELTVTGVETGGGVVFTFVGSLDTTGAVSDGVFTPETNLNPGVGTLEAWQGTTDAVLLNLQSSVSFGANVGSFNVGMGSGDNIAIFGDDLTIADSYVSGSPFAATLTFTATNLASLGVNAVGGPYVWTLVGSGDTITMIFPQYSLPPPAANNATEIARLKRKIRQLQKKARKAKKKGQKTKAKKLKRKLKKARKELKAMEP